MKNIIILCFTFMLPSLFAVPNPPTDPQHPGFPTRSKSFKKIKINNIRKGSFLFLPQVEEIKVPLVVFSHGQALKLANYESLFERFASKGIAVFYPKFDKGFFDTDWERMGADYDNLVTEVLKSYPQIDKEKIIYSGHSKGGYVGLMALGHRGAQNSSGLSQWSPKAALFYSPAGYEDDALAAIAANVPVHLVWPSSDSIIKEELIDEVFQRLPTNRKQKIVVQGYSDKEAGHFFPLTKKAIFGGENGIGPFHYYGIIQWTVGAIEENEFLYGQRALESGEENKPHLATRNF